MVDALNGKSEAKLQFKALPSPWSHIMTTGRTFANQGDLAGHAETKGASGIGKKLNFLRLEKSNKYVGGVVSTVKRYQSRRRRSSAQKGKEDSTRRSKSPAPGGGRQEDQAEGAVAYIQRGHGDPGPAKDQQRVGIWRDAESRQALNNSHGKT